MQWMWMNNARWIILVINEKENHKMMMMMRASPPPINIIAVDLFVSQFFFCFSLLSWVFQKFVCESLIWNNNRFVNPMNLDPGTDSNMLLSKTQRQTDSQNFQGLIQENDSFKSDHWGNLWINRCITHTYTDSNQFEFMTFHFLISTNLWKSWKIYPPFIHLTTPNSVIHFLFRFKERKK